jgi:2-polyprenyl-3-methyl-5-hydroxy-6-metoxy-1,4-benzoquinol methylase
MDTKAYYDTHLSRFYSWMAGDFETKQREFLDLLRSHNLKPTENRLAYDLGAGHGIQAGALTKAGFEVTAVDFNDQLLSELSANTAGLNIKIIKDDIRTVHKSLLTPAALITCWGDTLTHLNDLQEVRTLIHNMASLLATGGKMMLSFRDYTRALEGPARFIPVKSDNERILTCILEYETDHVIVTDLLNERLADGWRQTAMSYKKIRLNPAALVDILTSEGLIIDHNQTVKGMVTIIASKS